MALALLSNSGKRASRLSAIRARRSLTAVELSVAIATHSSDIELNDWGLELKTVRSGGARWERWEVGRGLLDEQKSIVEMCCSLERALSMIRTLVLVSVAVVRLIYNRRTKATRCHSIIIERELLFSFVLFERVVRVQIQQASKMFQIDIRPSFIEWRIRFCSWKGKGGACGLGWFVALKVFQ